MKRILLDLLALLAWCAILGLASWLALIFFVRWK